VEAPSQLQLALLLPQPPVVLGQRNSPRVRLAARRALPRQQQRPQPAAVRD
jgi:hypothetical protein